MPQYQRTIEQESILSFFKHDTRNGAINAVAGSGKTASVEDMIVEYVNEGGDPSDCLYLVFNKRNQLEAVERLPQGVQCKTLNALGYGAWRQSHPGLKSYIEKNKVYKIADALGLKPLKDKFPDFPRALSIAKVLGVVPTECDIGHRALTPDTYETWHDIFNRHGLSLGDYTASEAMELCQKGLLLSIEAVYGEAPFTPGGESMMDFDDQLYMPVCFGGTWPSPKNLFVDESQDMSLLNHEMIAHCLEGGGRLMMVGDPCQAIYGFRGADKESFDLMVERFDCVALTLSTNFRCDRAIIMTAQDYVPHITARPTAGQGLVEVAIDWSPLHFEPGDVILCRNTKPLIGLFYSCLEHRLPARILGSDIGRGLIATVNRVLKRDATRAELQQGIDRWVTFEYNKATEAKMNARADIVLSQGRILHTVLEHCQHEGALRAQMVDELTHMFSDKVFPICLSTVHKAKGMEWDRVWFLDPQLIPSPWATEPHELQQEQNIAYVAVTRAKHSLGYIKTEDMEMN
jgi:hypothetical protein